MQKRGFFSNNKGTLVTRQMLIHLGMIGLLVLIYFFLDAYVDSIRQDTQFEQLFLSRDIALLMNSLYSAPGNVEYTYSFENLDLSKYNFELKELSSSDDKPIVEVKGHELKKTYPYATNSLYKGTYRVSGAKEIKFSKSGSKIIITKNE